MTYYDVLYKNDDAVMTLLTPLDAEFTGLFKREKALFNKMRKSDFTKKIAGADRRMDDDITGMNNLVRAGLHSPTGSTREAAERLHNRFAAFGDIARRSYEEEPADVMALVTDLTSAGYKNEVTALNMTTWVTDLLAALQAFNGLIIDRRDEETAKPEGKLADVRRQLDKVYRQMVDMVESAATIDTAGAYEEFIRELNYEIKRYNDDDHEHARKDLGATDHCVVEPVETLAYTGKAVTPIVKAFYREEGKTTIELVFSRDFFLTYKNNVEVGTAVVTLHGKGGYKGQFHTTFNIARGV
jgi:hypothetical protein